MGQLKGVARALAPAPVKAAWGKMYGRLKIQRAGRALGVNTGAACPSYLPANAISTLMARNYQPPAPIRYDADGLVDRAAEKVDQLAREMDLSAVGTALELGCWDGMVVAALRARGVSAFGLDMTMRGVDDRARQSSSLVQSDAEAIAIADESVDLVYSFASFEHFPHPDRCMREVHRVLKPGGRVYVHFGPLYLSPYGLHAYRQIPIPFCHLLFDDAELHRWAGERGLPHDWPFVNGWSLAQYRALWRSLESQFSVVTYREHTTGGVGTELVAEYPQCFRGRIDDVEELLVAFVDVGLAKR